MYNEKMVWFSLIIACLFMRCKEMEMMLQKMNLQQKRQVKAIRL